MENLYLASCALFFCLLICGIFFTKKHIKNYETKLYSRLLVLSLLDCILVFFTAIVAFFIFNEDTFFFLTKLNYCVYIYWAYNYFLYIFYLTFKDSISYTNNLLFFNKLCFVLNIILVASIFFYDITLNNFNGISYADGYSTNFLFYGCGIYFSLIIIATLFNLKKINKRKNIALLILIILLFLTLLLRQVNPSLVIFSLVLTYINFILYFTIENPDIKTINELNIAKDSAVQANHAKSDFLSSMSHEIRTPLNAIVGFSSCITESKTLEEAFENAHDIISASNSLLEIVNGILDISKIEAGKLELVNIDYRLSEIIDDVTRLIKLRIGEKDIVLNTNISKKIPNVLLGDKMNVKKIIVNLLTNAVKYTDNGYINFTVNCEIIENKCCITIIVEDSGRGIKPEEADKLFTKFQRLEEDKNSTIEGTGLGLCITKQLIEMMDGKVTAESKYGVGTIFTAVIYQEISNNEIVSTKKEYEIYDFSNKCILLVDDNLINIKVASKLLSKYNLNIETCMSGEEALEILNNKTFDLVFLDDMMPNMRGTEVFKILQDNKNFTTPVIALTANALNGTREFYLSLGFNDYLSKPIDNDELNSLLCNHLCEKKTSFLVVDDNLMNIKIATKFLESFGYEVDSCNSGFECLNKNMKYDIIFMDIMMPKMDGIETLHKLKEMKNFNIPVVALTADAVSGAEEHYISEGFDAYISKPLTKDSLLKTMKKL